MHQRNQYYYMLISLLFFSSFLYVQNLMALNPPISPKETQIISVHTDQQEFEITLKSNPTTGYQWYLVDINDNLIHATHKKYSNPLASKQPVRVGAGGVENWHFKVAKSAFVVPRITSITFHYLRPWQIANQTTSTHEAVTYKIIINPFKKPTHSL